uniref:Uncharacterized protein n=1 Tax=Anopheles farauti TaxID=69004 RepID=A0A182QP03_9DIPT
MRELHLRVDQMLLAGVLPEVLLELLLLLLLMLLMLMVLLLLLLLLLLVLLLLLMQLTWLLSSTTNTLWSGVRVKIEVPSENAANVGSGEMSDRSSYSVALSGEFGSSLVAASE